jgi:hypothetical protein
MPYVRPLILAALPLLGGCAVAAATGVAVVVTEEMQDKAMVSTVEEEVDVVWASTKSTLAHMTDALLHIDDDLRQAQTKVDNAVVVVEVKNHDVNETQVRVSAKKVMIFSPEVAELVSRRIVKDITSR